MHIRVHSENILENILKKEYDNIVLGGDVGGTHTNIGIAGVKNNKIVLLFSAHFDSQKIDSIVEPIQETLKHAFSTYRINIETGCAGIAGAVAGCRKSKPTNLPWEVDAEVVKEETSLKKFYLINDIQAIWYGMKEIHKEDIVEVKKGEQNLYVFSWDEIPGNDNKRLTQFLTQEFRIDWVKNAKIEKIDNCKTIKVSAENKSLSLKLDDKNTEVILEIDDHITNKFIAKMEEGKLNIYQNLNDTKAIIGAGTGLGKSIVVSYEYDDISVPIPSEGGHGDFPICDCFDLELIDHIRGKRENPVSYEEILSGRGIEKIYSFLREKYGMKYNNTEYYSSIANSEDKAAQISKFKERDKLCADTFKIYTKYYARCSKNFVLDTKATGGLFIAGGIAANNSEIFMSNEFLTEFLKSEKQRPLLEDIPIYIVKNYDVSLYGACRAAIDIIPSCRRYCKLPSRTSPSLSTQK